MSTFKKYDNQILGLIIGLIAPLLVMLVYYQLNFSYMKISSFIFDMFLRNVLVPLLSLCAVANLLCFYIFIWTNKNYSAKGVIFATMIYAFLVFGYKLLN